MGSEEPWSLSPGFDTLLLPHQYQGFRVQLDSVKKLNDLEKQLAFSPHLQAQNVLPTPCYHQALPLDLQPICTSTEAATTFQALSECRHLCEASCLLFSSSSHLSLDPGSSASHYFS